MRVRMCPCGQGQTTSSNGRCKPCHSAYMRAYRARPGGKEQTRALNLKMFYGITPERYDALLVEQGGRCAVCQETPGTRPLCVDHDHGTGEIRGLLCDHCNKAVGFLRDNPVFAQRAAEYLVAHDRALAHSK